jgi:hypothetical protein
MGDDQEFAAVGSDEIVPELIVKEGEDIDYRVVMVFYLLADLGSVSLFFLSAVCNALNSTVCTRIVTNFGDEQQLLLEQGPKFLRVSLLIMLVICCSIHHMFHFCLRRGLLGYYPAIPATHHMDGVQGELDA